MTSEGSVAGKSSNWRPRHAYAWAAICLLLGVALGYLFRGSETSRSAGAAAVGTQAATNPSAPHMPTLEQMKRMADVKAKPLLAKLQSDPNNADLLAQIGKIYESTHQFKEATGYYEKALAIDPKNVGIRNEVASCLYYTGDADGAVKQLEQALKDDPKNPNSLFNLGMIRWQAKQDPQGAVTLWKQLLKLNPKLEGEKKAQVEKLIAEANQNNSLPQQAKEKF